MASPGLLDWANSIRLQISNDSAKHIFQEQIQQLGFNFLEARLDTVMAGPKKESNILELIKTPGRKKTAASSKAKAASKLKNTISYSLEDDDTVKENVAPFNTFHQALLQAKSKKGDQASYDDPRDPFHGKPVEQPVVQQVELVVVSSPLREPEHEELPSRSADSDTLAAPRSEQNELSVIAEDDEERSRMSIQLHRSGLVTATAARLPEEEHIETVATTAPSSPMTHKAESLTTTSSKEIFYSLSTVSSKETFDITPASSSDTFHSIPLDSPAIVPPVVTEPPQSPEPAPPPHSDSPVVAQLPVTQPSRTSKPDSENFAAPLPEIPPWHPPTTQQHESVNAPLPTPATTTPKAAPNDLIEDIVVPIHDPTTPALGLTRKASVPNLPAPMMPMRKSMRTPRDPSMGLGPTVSMGSVLGSATPGAPMAGGKRTSWLMKAREVKAMEDTGKRTSTFALNVPGMSSGGSNNKRKSGEMLGEVPTSQTEEEDSDRSHKSAKINGMDLAPFKPTSKSLDKDREENLAAMTVSSSSQQPIRDVPAAQAAAATEVGVLDRFKKNLEGLGVRFGKSTGKSLGGPGAASALAEARAAAEARIGQRQKDKEELTSGSQEIAVMAAATAEQKVSLPSKETQVDVAVPKAATRSSDPVKKAESRLSVSDLVAVYDGGSGGTKEREKPFQLVPPFHKVSHQDAGDTSTSTTPPNSPPPTRPTQFAPPPGPVFNKPPRVFVPPPPAAKDSALPPSTSTVFSKPAPVAMGLPLHIPAPSPSEFQKRTMPLSAQSTLESMASGSLFDDDVPAWMPRTQDTEYSTAPLTQSQSQAQRLSELDEDDSWPLDEKLSPSIQWAFGVSKEDSMTWSSLPAESQRGYSGSMVQEPERVQEPEPEPQSQEEVPKGSKTIPGAFNMDVDDDEAYEEEDGLVVSESDFEGLADNGQSTVSLVPKPVLRSNSQLSMASSSSSNTGFLGHASKLVNSVLGTSKKGKTEVKSLQLAAMAAKKQQEEKDKKAARLKEMEHRRQLALQRKADEEKAKAIEEERRIKEDGERRKREREEHTDKRPLKGATKKEDDNTKKRKIEQEKKQEIKKPSSKVGKPSAMKSGMKQPVVMTSSTAYNASHQTAGASSSTTVKAADVKPSKMPAKGKGKAPAPKAPIDDDDIAQPAQIVQTQMAARAKAQLQAAKAVEPPVASESIELPDINSEYSDSDDEDRPRTFDPPDWAQSPELRQALQMQSTINPDQIFGEIRPLRMEELFRTRTSRFRARTSSANWAGSDRLTIEEETEYARRMGFR